MIQPKEIMMLGQLFTFLRIDSSNWFDVFKSKNRTRICQSMSNNKVKQHDYQLSVILLLFYHILSYLFDVNLFIFIIHLSNIPQTSCSHPVRCGVFFSSEVPWRFWASWMVSFVWPWSANSESTLAHGTWKKRRSTYIYIHIYNHMKIENYTILFYILVLEFILYWHDLVMKGIQCMCGNFMNLWSVINTMSSHVLFQLMVKSTVKLFDRWWIQFHLLWWCLLPNDDHS